MRRPLFARALLRPLFLPEARSLPGDGVGDVALEAADGREHVAGAQVLLALLQTLLECMVDVGRPDPLRSERARRLVRRRLLSVTMFS